MIMKRTFFLLVCAVFAYVYAKRAGSDDALLGAKHCGVGNYKIETVYLNTCSYGDFTIKL